MIKKAVALIFKGVGDIIFKTILFPVYRLFLLSKRHVDKYLLHGSTDPGIINKNNGKKNLVPHIITFIIFLFVIINNFATRETYAEEFGKNSIMAQLATEQIDVEITEYSKPIEFIEDKPKTESVLDKLAAVEIKNDIANGNEDIKKEDKTEEKMSLAQGGEALIKPNITPFEPEDAEVEIDTLISKNIQNYIVQSGDTLSAIAEKFGVSINTILWENNLSLNSYIRPGDKLAILPVTGVSYNIKSGDTLSKVAAEFGTTIDKISSFNNIDPGAVLAVRQKIIIPDGKLGYTNIAPSRSIPSLKNIFSASNGKASDNDFLWPSVSKRITQYYHWGHHAIDIGAKSGTPIYACRGGRVERAGWSTGYGYNIIIDHGGGVKTLYAHASKLYVKRGDQVSQGEVVGAVGSTGWSTGPHIHLEIRINGSKVNPLSYL